MTRDEILTRNGSLVILRTRPGAADAPDIFLTIGDDGRVTGFSGHVDLGTGIRTALAQIVAEELDVGLTRVAMVLGDTGLTPDQGPTIASETIQIAAIPLRAAAAQARSHLLALAASELGLPAEALHVEDGIVAARDVTNRHVSYGDLLVGRAIRLELALDTPVKQPEFYRIVGQPVPRTDIPAKVTGLASYVHDVRVPGMLHGRVVRPPYAGVDAGDFVGTSLISVDRASVAHLPGVVDVVVEGDFIGVVAEREEQAIAAAEALQVEWRPTPKLTGLDDLAGALRTNPSTPRKLLDKGDVEAAIASAAKPMPRSYLWPYHLHGSIGPSCSVADWRDGTVTVWSGTQNPHMLRADLAKLLDLSENRVNIIRHEAAGCYGRNCADDVGADAALLSRAVGRPVRVQLTREQEHAWEPKGAAQLMEVSGGLNADGSVAAYDFSTRYPSNGAPLLALLLTGKIPPTAQMFEMGDRTSIAPYGFENMRVVVHDMKPILRAAWLRGVSALPNSFAHESYMDELAHEAGADPIDFRLRYLDDPRAVDLIKAVAARAEWQPRTGPRLQVVDAETVKGQGFAYAVYVHGKFPGVAAAWSAWVAEVEVNKATGEVVLTRVVAGQDTGLMINPAGIEHQIHGNVIQSASRVLREEVTFADGIPEPREWGGYPVLKFPELPVVNVLMMPRQDQPPLGAGESASVPSAAAIANAIFDATGVRLREVPFTPDRVKASLGGGAIAARPAPRKKAARRRILAPVAAAFAAALTAGAVSLALRPVIAPIARPDPGVFSAETLARGERLAALGDCAVCHTADDGIRNAGGRAFATPFGTVHAPNITPDSETGIGAWSYPAFERAMRQGIHRDGRQLYPVFPYEFYARTSDADLQALYAYLMAQAPARSSTPNARFIIPVNFRPLMAGWNTLFHDATPFQTDPARSEAWNRGAYLVEGLGHCGACHSPRNVLGAVKRGAAHLTGGEAEGWEAPALTALGKAPVPWTESALYSYLRTGHSEHHGVAAGPMAPVIRELSALPDEDVRAMAIYLAALNGSAPEALAAEQLAAELKQRALEAGRGRAGMGATLYDGACAVCHEADAPVLFGVRPSLALNTSLHSARPDNLVHVILNGITEPAHPDLGAMPAFRNSLSDRQIVDLIDYLRQRFAPDEPPWANLADTVARLRKAARVEVTR